MNWRIVHSNLKLSSMKKQGKLKSKDWIKWLKIEIGDFSKSSRRSKDRKNYLSFRRSMIMKSIILILRQSLSILAIRIKIVEIIRNKWTINRMQSRIMVSIGKSIKLSKFQCSSKWKSLIQKRGRFLEE